MDDTQKEAVRAKTFITLSWIQCPACGNPQAGRLHRTSARLWQGRADRARSHDGTDPLSGVTLEDAERHLTAIGAGLAQMPGQ